MKRIFAALFMIVYTLSTTGATFYFNNCTKSLSFQLQDHFEKSEEHNCNLCCEDSSKEKNHSCSASDVACKHIELQIEKVSTKVTTVSPIETTIYLTPYITRLYWIATSFYVPLEDYIPNKPLYTSNPNLYQFEDLYLANNILRI